MLVNDVSPTMIMPEKFFPFSTHLSRKIEIFQNMEHVAAKEKKSDAWEQKSGSHALIGKMKLMHGACFLRAKTSEMARHEGTKGFFMSICGIIIRKYSVFLSWNASNNLRREVGCYGYRVVLLESDVCPLVFLSHALTLIPELMHEPLFSAFLHHFPDSHR